MRLMAMHEGAATEKRLVAKPLHRIPFYCSLTKSLLSHYRKQCRGEVREAPNQGAGALRLR